MEQTRQGGTTPASPELAREIQATYDRAVEAWPGVALSEEVFAAHLGTVLPDEEDLVAALKHVHQSDLFLVCACAHGDRSALRAFEEQIIPFDATIPDSLTFDPS